MRDNPPAPYLELVDTLIKSWSDLTVFPPSGSTHAAGVRKQPIPQRAYLLFNRSDDNPLAQALENEFPKWARDRFTVPDRQFENRTEHAPFILELPQEMVLAAPDPQGQAVREWLARCLEFTAQQVNQRIPRQDFCGVVISAASPQTITRHWVGLGDQRPPDKDESALFRYQDPRVMQRVWPALSPLQQSRWFGPVTHWWSLLQPWGPFSDLPDVPDPPKWFHAKAPVLPHGMQAGGSSRDLFDEEQWVVAGASPQANQIWRSYADHGIAPEVQPDPDSLVLMLTQAARLGLDGLDLEDYVWITWMHAPKEGPARVGDWSLPQMAQTLSRIEAQMRVQPDARFSSLFAQAIRTPT